MGQRSNGQNPLNGARVLTKTAKILKYLKTPRTGVELRAKFGYVKSLLKNLRQAGCVIYTKQPVGGDKTWPQLTTHLYVATGKPYELHPGRPIENTSPSQVRRRETLRRWADANKEQRKVYQRAYYALKLSAAARAKQG